MKNGRKLLGIVLVLALVLTGQTAMSGRAAVRVLGRGAVSEETAGEQGTGGPGSADRPADESRAGSGPSTGPGYSSRAAQEEETAEVNIRMVGDDLIHEALLNDCRQADGSYNFDMLYENMKAEIQAADVAIINQETILISNPAQASGYPTFGTPEAIGHSLVSAGFDVIAHATNHTMDKGAGAILGTVNFWKTNYPYITYLGIHDTPEDSEIRYLTSRGIKIGFVNYTYGLNGIRRPAGKEYCVDLLTDGGIEATVQEARANCDLLIAVLHVGDEYVYTPTAYAQQQVNRFIDLGADIVLCAHPHVLEPFGMITTPGGNTGLVYYSLGNYVSAQQRMPRVLGGMADITVKKAAEGSARPVEIVKYDLVPLVTHFQGGYVTTYRLDQYPDEMAARHSVALTKQKLWDLYYGIMNGTAR